MAWNYRRSVRLPLGFRLNFSKSGVGWSMGVPGYRRGITSQGRQYSQLSILGTGIYNRQYGQRSGAVGHHHWFAIVMFVLGMALLRGCI